MFQRLKVNSQVFLHLILIANKCLENVIYLYPTYYIINNWIYIFFDQAKPYNQLIKYTKKQEMNQNITKEDIRANKRKIKCDMKSLISNCLKNQNQSIHYKLEKSNQTISQMHNFEGSNNIENVVVINGVNFWKTKSKFQDQYIKLKKIGEGSQSVVYQCKEKATGTLFATKMLANVEQEKTQFIKSKFQILSSFDDDHIIKTKAIFINQNERTCHIILQYCPYQTLRQFMVENKGKVQEQTVWKIIRQILCGLKVLNENNIFHRDLKPQNLLYNPISGLIKIIDFETSKRFTYENTLSTQTGTLLYRAPQTFKGFYGKKIDIWSIGIISYQMIFQSLPFFSQSQKDTIKSIKQSPLIMKKDIISIEMQNFLNQLLQKQEKDRISLQDALQWINEQFQDNLKLNSKQYSYSTNNSIFIDEIESPQIQKEKKTRHRKASQPMLLQIEENYFTLQHMKDFFI